MTKIRLPFNSLLDKDIANSKINFIIYIYNKNKTVSQILGFSQSFSIHEIYNHIKTKYPNKNFEIEIELKTNNL